MCALNQEVRSEQQAQAPALSPELPKVKEQQLAEVELIDKFIELSKKEIPFVASKEKNGPLKIENKEFNAEALAGSIEKIIELFKTNNNIQIKKDTANTLFDTLIDIAANKDYDLAELSKLKSFKGQENNPVNKRLVLDKTIRSLALVAAIKISNYIEESSAKEGTSAYFRMHKIESALKVENDLSNDVYNKNTDYRYDYSFSRTLIFNIANLKNPSDKIIDQLIEASLGNNSEDARFRNVEIIYALGTYNYNDKIFEHLVNYTKSHYDLRGFPDSWQFSAGVLALTNIAKTKNPEKIKEVVTLFQDLLPDKKYFPFSAKNDIRDIRYLIKALNSFGKEDFAKEELKEQGSKLKEKVNYLLTQKLEQAVTFAEEGKVGIAEQKDLNSRRREYTVGMKIEAYQLLAKLGIDSRKQVEVIEEVRKIRIEGPVSIFQKKEIIKLIQEFIPEKEKSADSKEQSGRNLESALDELSELIKDVFTEEAQKKANIKSNKNFIAEIDELRSSLKNKIPYLLEQKLEVSTELKIYKLQEQLGMDSKEQESVRVKLCNLLEQPSRSDSNKLEASRQLINLGLDEEQKSKITSLIETIIMNKNSNYDSIKNAKALLDILKKQNN